MQLTLGMTVTFKHRRTYNAPAGQPLTGVVHRIVNAGNGRWEVSVYSEAAGVDYGLLSQHLRAVSKTPESAAVRLENLKRCDAAKRERLSVYPVWQANFAENPDYTFFPVAIAAVEAAL